MATLRQKTVSGLIWSFIDNFAVQGIQFVVGIILARLLSPREFGLIGMIIVFIAVSETFINGGFMNALIQKKECSEADYSTVFFFNLFAGILFFFLLFFSAKAIGRFFNEPELKSIVQVLGLVLVIDALSMIQRTILTKRIDFKMQTHISVIASFASGGISIVMAYSGFGVWSLVAHRLCRQGLISIFLWLWNGWRPTAVFSKASFRELFGFGSKLLLSRLIATIYRNIYLLVIGKFFSAQDLGFYTRADTFKKLPSENLMRIISRVSYPVLAEIRDDKIRLKTSYQKLIRCTMLITFVLMLGLAAVAEPMTIALVGEKWRPSIVYLQMLCFVGMMYPLQALNLNMLQVKGRSDLFLKLEIIKRTLAVPVIVVGIFCGIKAMIGGLIILALVSNYLNSYWSGMMIDYPLVEQVKDIFPSFALASIMAAAVFLLGMALSLAPLLKLVIQVITGAVFVFGVGEMFRLRDYLFIKELIGEKVGELKKNEFTL